MAEYSSSRDEASTSANTALEKSTSGYKRAIERYLRSIRTDNSQLSGAATESLEAGGKRLRPIVTLLVCESVCGNYERALPIATVYELAHASSLIQDDIIDESPLRHGRVTPHRKYGTARAILVSDTLIFDIFGELSKYQETKISKSQITQLLRLVANAAKGTAEGEFLEMSIATNKRVLVEEYVRLATLKTGSLIAAAAASGAVVGGASKRVVDAAYQFGQNLGVAFQIRDDILDIVGDAQNIGKPVLKDLQNNATNIVLVHALSKATPYQRQVISSMLWRKWFAISDVQRLMTTLEELGSIEEANGVASGFAENARKSLARLPPSHARDVLQQLSHMLEVRRI